LSARTTQAIHITVLFPELLGVGGVQEAGRLTAFALDEIAQSRGWSSGFAALNDPAGPHALRLNDAQVQFQGFARSKTRFVLSAIKRARDAADCQTHIILAGHPNLAPIAVWMQKTSPHARAIVVAHGVDVWTPLPMLRRATLKASFLVAAPSGYTIQMLIQVQKVPANRTRKLPWPLNPAFLNLADRPETLAAPDGFPKGDVLLTVGRAAAAERYKGTDNLIRAFAELRDEFPRLQLVSVGGGDDLGRLQTLAKALGVADRVHFLQDLSRPQVAACYARSQIFALPSGGEGFGLVFLEAMAFGKPVVAAAAGGALDVVRDEVNGLLVPPQDVTSLAAALRRLLSDEPLRKSLSRRGAAMVRDAYQFSSFRSELERLLDECTMDSRLRK
jgi:phosphatidylinositol alpha-1,6-mannosyltransferase